MYDSVSVCGTPGCDDRQTSDYCVRRAPCALVVATLRLSGVIHLAIADEYR